MGKQILLAAVLLAIAMLPTAAPAQTTPSEGLRMTREEFINLLEKRGDAVYIVDNGLITFGKFALTLLAMFGLVGVFFFGWDFKKASEEAKQARFETQKTLLELTPAKEDLSQIRKDIIDRRKELEQELRNARQELDKHLGEAAESLTRTLGIEQEILRVRFHMEALGGNIHGAAAVASTKIDQPSLIPDRTYHIAIVTQLEQVELNNLPRIVAALQKQVANDFRPIWNVNATIEIYDTLERVPSGCWPMIIREYIGVGEDVTGVHLTSGSRDDQPFALIKYTKDSDRWTLAASSTLLSMLINPFGTLFIQGPSPNPVDKGKIVDFSVEISAPVGGEENGYSIDGVLVSDFVTPAFFEPSKRKGVRYSFTGSAKEPLKILRAGFLSWNDKETNELYQWTWSGTEPLFKNLGKLSI
jgi:hypothetical protein